MDNLRKDLIHALRSLSRQPGFTIVTVLTLALGIGANTAIFSVVNGVLLRPLGYPQPNQLEFITSRFPQLGFDQFWVSLPEALEFRDHNESFSSVGAYSAGAVNIDTKPATRVISATVTPEFMPTLDVRPAAGRWFTTEDSRPGAEPVAILSSEIWRRNYGSDPATVDRRVMIDNVSTRIVGIMPPGYDIHDQHVEVWVPLTIPTDQKTLLNQRGSHYLYMVGRRKDGVTPDQARADVGRMVNQWAQAYAPGGTGHSPNAQRHPLRVDPLKTDIVGGVRTALLVLQGAVVFVLLIACANLANLLLARAESRQREFAVRAALGAGRLRLLRQFVTEGIVLALMAATAGVGLAWIALRALLTVNPEAIPRSAEIALDWRVLGFTLALAVLTGFIFGLAPLWHLGSRLVTSLRDGTRSTAGRARRAFRNGLVVAEVAFAVTLVVGAGLLIRSFVNLLNVDPGFDRSHLITFGLVPPVSGNTAAQQVVDLFNRLDERLAALPGVQHVTAMSGLPPNRSVDANDTDFELIPNNPPPGSNLPIENVDFWQYVMRDYIETMGIPMVKGRAFEASDVGGAPVALVNEALVRRFFSGVDPIGQRLKISGGEKNPWFTVVGVVKDVKQGGVDAPVGTELYLLADQLPGAVGYSSQSMNVVVRTAMPIDAVMPAIRQTVRDIDPTLPLVKVRTMDEVFGQSVARPRFLTLLLGIFAGLALTLAAVGTYGVLSYLVTSRRQEIGIRMALGADRARILQLVLVRGLALSGTGLLLGLAASFGLTRLIASLLFNVRPADPAILAGVAAVIAGVAVVACLVPAWRATRVDPLVVFRES